MSQKKPNFLEMETLEGANQVDLDEYTFVRFSEHKQCYIFKIREDKRISHK